VLFHEEKIDLPISLCNRELREYERWEETTCLQEGMFEKRLKGVKSGRKPRTVTVLTRNHTQAHSQIFTGIIYVIDRTNLTTSEKILEADITFFDFSANC